MSTFGVLAEFETPAGLYQACEKVRDAGFRRWDAHTPFPVHGLDRAMGIPRSKVPLIVFGAGMSGAIGGMVLQWWVSAIDYKLIIAAKPLFSWQAFIPVTFETMVLFSAFGAVFGMLFLSRLPQWYHPLFRSERFKRFSDHRFFISIEATDPKFNSDETARFLEGLGARRVELVEE
jgi:hypothetical protein